MRDPALAAAQQALVLRAHGTDPRQPLSFILDDRVVARRTAPFEAEWLLAPGEHRLEVESAAGTRSAPVRFLVD